MLTTIQNAWAWTGLDAEEVVDANAFGNVIVRARNGGYWRICLEELSCALIAANALAYDLLRRDDDFKFAWEMENLVHLAQSEFGRPTADRCYCLKVPAVLGGSYEVENFGTISRDELIGFAGDIAQQLKDLPDGISITFSITNGT